MKSNLLSLEEAIIQYNPFQKQKVHLLFSNMDNDMRCFLNIYMNICMEQGENIDFLAKSYIFLVKETLKEQIFFSKTGCYRNKTYQEVKEKVYNNKEYMKMYMTGLAISTALWENHKKMFAYFREIFLNKYVEGKYLEIGPGHGLFFLEAIKNTNCKYYEAIDISETSIELTKKILRAFDISDKFTLIKEDFLKKNFKGKYDTIVMGEVLEHVENPKDFLLKSRSLLSRNAKMYISSCLNAPEPDHIYLFSSLDQIEDLFKSVGLYINDRLILPYSGYTIEQTIVEKLPMNVAYVLSVQ